MIQCKDCEFFEEQADGKRVFKCDPFKNIKEPECLLKWQLLRLDMVAGGFFSMNAWQQKIAPLQNKIFKYVKREIEDLEESDQWKQDPEDPEETDIEEIH